MVDFDFIHLSDRYGLCRSGGRCDEGTRNGIWSDKRDFQILPGGWDGVLTVVQGYLYLYIPLLTMNLMSRELGSGSIKLLYSSPVTNVQIILGKYLSMLIYALVLVGILVLYVIIGAIIIKNFDYPQVLTGLLGIYFLICAYAAIGLLMSSLTSYQVVAAVGTLAVLSLLTYVQGWWQDIEFVRDLTYWLAMPGVLGSFCQEWSAVQMLFISFW